jgi:hypothetical protein
MLKIITKKKLPNLTIQIRHLQINGITPETAMNIPDCLFSPTPTVRYPFGPPGEVHSLEKHANSKPFPTARAYQHRTTMILNLGDASYKIHTTSKTN